MSAELQEQDGGGMLGVPLMQIGGVEVRIEGGPKGVHAAVELEIPDIVVDADVKLPCIGLMDIALQNDCCRRPAVRRLLSGRTSR
ncbi:hypothetical protein GCM10008949_24350 [Deinococcus humi]|nr:hypothetical protein GCM10008949_24350 [Deinococcus humi]